MTKPLRIIAFGAHPDDNELRAAGVAARWAAAGHQVKFVSVTNGDVGHFAEGGGPLAIRRTAEVRACARLLGIETQVLDIHDGELMPSLENRKIIGRLIREWQADIVLGHRPYDYHPDHRYVGVLLDDTAVVVAAPFFASDTPPTAGNPIYLYYADDFAKPYPFQPAIVVGIDDVADTKWQCISAMPSQFCDRDSWQARTLPGVPAEDAERGAWLLDQFKRRNEQIADRYRDHLIALHGDAVGRRVRYAEAFELSQYGRQVSFEELRALFLAD